MINITDLRKVLRPDSYVLDHILWIARVTTSLGESLCRVFVTVDEVCEFVSSATTDATDIEVRDLRSHIEIKYQIRNRLGGYDRGPASAQIDIHVSNRPSEFISSQPISE